MQGIKKSIFIFVLSCLLPLSVLPADDDGTFTITIQGPDVETTAPVRQQRRPSRQNQSSAQNYYPQNYPQYQNNEVYQNEVQGNGSALRTYNVKPGDTIWSVAHRYAQANPNINEFQVIASIYRYNPRAFAGGNVNNLVRTTLRIPPDSEIAREDMSVGSALLNAGSMTLPPLPQYQRQLQQVPAGSQQYATQNQQGRVNQQGGEVPSYTATETRIREYQEQKEREANGELIENGVNSNRDMQNGNDRRNNRQQTTPNAPQPVANQNTQNTNTAQAQTPEDQTSTATLPDDAKLTKQQVEEVLELIKKNGGNHDSVDAKSTSLMLDETKKQIEKRIKVLEQQLADALARMKKTSAVTAQTAADSVSSLSSQYDNIIAGIQQDIIEIKGNVSKISQDNDSMREMLLANDEKIEDMQLQMAQFTVSSVDTTINLDKPLMMILLGAGFLSVVVLIIFLIFKSRARAHARKYTDDFDTELDGNEDVLLSDDNSSMDLGNIDVPPPPESDDEKNSAEKNSTEETNTELTASTPDAAADAAKKAQADWDKAQNDTAPGAENKDQAVLDEWSKALNEDDKNKSAEVEVKSDDESVADAWASALGEQAQAEKTGENEKTASGEQEDMAAAWAAALGEQADAESGAKKEESAASNEQEDMAAAWAAALGEQADAESGAKKEESAPSNEQEDMAAAWAAALGEQEQKDTAPKSSEKKIADSPKSPDKAQSKAPVEPKNSPKLAQVATEAAALEASMSKAMAQKAAKDHREPKANPDNSIAESAGPEVNPDDLIAESADTEVNPDELIAESAAPEVNPGDLVAESAAPENNPDDSIAESAAPEVNPDDLVAESADSEVNPDELIAESADTEVNPDELIAESADTEVNPDDLIAESAAPEVNSDDLVAESADTEVNPDDLIAENVSPEANPADLVAESDALDVNPDDLTADQNEITDNLDDHLPESTTADPKTAGHDEEIVTEPKAIPQSEIEHLAKALNPEDRMSEIPKSVADFDLGDDDFDISNIVGFKSKKLPGHVASLVDNERSDEAEDFAQSLEKAANMAADDSSMDASDLKEALDGAKSEPVAEDTLIQDSEDADENLTESLAESSDTALEKNLVESTDDLVTAEENSPTSVNEIVDDDIDLEELLRPVDTQDEHDTLDKESGDTQEEVSETEGDEPLVQNEDLENLIQSEESSDISQDVEVGDSNIPPFEPETDVDPELGPAPAMQVDTNEVSSSDVPDENGSHELLMADMQEKNAAEPSDAATVETFAYPQEQGTDESALKDETPHDVVTDDGLDNLESRMSNQPENFDAESEQDLMNMLSGEKEDTLDPIIEEPPVGSAFTPDEMAKMINGDVAVLDEESSFEKVHDKIGAINSQEESENNDDSIFGLTPKEHQYYVDELNLARLYFETGDNEEALRIIDDVREHGSPDLIEEIEQILENYNS